MHENNVNISGDGEKTIKQSENEIFAHVSRTLASRYEVIYYVDVNTSEYRIYSASDEYSNLGTQAEGSDFFADAVRDINTLIHPEDREMVISALDKENLIKTIDRDGTFELSYRQILEGRQQYVSILIMYATGDHSHLVIGVSNADVQVRHQQELESKNRTFNEIATALASKYEVIYTVNTETGEYNEYSTSENFRWSESGYSGTDFFSDTERNIKTSVYPEDYPMVADVMTKESLLKKLNAFGKFTMSYRLVIEGEPSYVSLYAVKPSPESENIIIAVANVDDTKKVMYDVTHDMQTGIYTREYLYSKIAEMFRNNPDTEYYICYVDVMNFKVVNDIFGTEFGNYAIKHIADWFRENLSHRCCYGRLLGINFGICMPKDEFDLQKFEDRLSKFILKNEKAEYHILVHVGVYEADPETTPIPIMFDRANLSLSTINDEYKTHIAFYNDKLREQILWDQEITAQLRKAVEEMQLKPYLQPIADKEGKVVGAEALARWEHPKYGFLAPYKFIPTFEKNGMIVEVDRHMWECSCRLLAKWKEKNPDLFISVNISPKNFYFFDVVSEIKKLVEKYGINPANLRIEITETVMMNDAENRMQILENFRSAGFIVEMDDFGSGYSSLNMLKQMPVDVLKIDMKFLGSSDDSDKANIIVRNVISLTRELGITSLTEGVETQNQYNTLNDMGCILFQGYYFAKPMPVEEFEKFAGLTE
ncbi:MAG: EAL domain-containing protein [Oscillospiraceae bacterium]|nr:EAL domain-containing protein [Oscillospiraceae bacterium]